jgi:prepilin-type N-terminal cleavage/methylation domain-containing protein
MKTAFTLSELLISLSALGLIMALTLPNVFNAVESQRKRAIFKETHNVIQNAHMAAVMDGSLTSTTFGTFFDRLSVS